MAYDDTEIEIKVPVSETEHDRIYRVMSDSGALSTRKEHSDHYFSPASGSFLDTQFPYKWLSVRKRGTRTQINYKHFYPEGAERHTHADEVEVAIDDIDRGIKLLDALGFVRLVTVHKIRLEFVIDEKFEVSLDKVDGLGYFVEVESLVEQGSIHQTRQSVLDFAAALGLDTDSADPRGYPYRLLQLNGLL